MSALLIIPVFCGWFAGYLVNYLSDVLPATRKLSPPACVRCNEYFSVRNYLLFTKCTNGHSRSLRTWIVQLSGIAAALFLWFSPPHKIGLLGGSLLTIYFAIVFIIDLEHRLILNMTSIVGAILGLILGYLMHGLTTTLIGGVVGFGIMIVFYYLGILFTRYRSRKMKAQGKETDDEEALGAGDVILVTILGLLLGWPLIWFSLFFGILLGGIISLIIVLWLVISRKYGENALMVFIPYGPYFLTSTYLIIFFPSLVSKLLPA